MIEQTNLDKRRISDEIRLIHATSWADNVLKLVVPITRSLVVLSVVFSGSWMMANQIPIQPEAWKLALVIFGAFFGSEVVNLVRVRLNGNAK